MDQDDTPRNRWANAGLLLRNAFALSNMARHGTPDIGEKGNRLNEVFLRKMFLEAREAFRYFFRGMTRLKEDVTEAEFENLLREYLAKFLELAGT